MAKYPRELKSEAFNLASQPVINLAQVERDLAPRQS